MLLHSATDCQPMRCASRHGQPIAKPVHVVRVQVAADDLRSLAARRFFNYGLKLLNPFCSVDPSVEMSIPDTDITRGGLQNCGEGETASASGTQIVPLQMPDLHIADRIPTKHREALVVNAGSGRCKHIEVPQSARKVAGNVCVVCIRNFLQQKHVRVMQSRNTAKRTHYF